MKHSAPVNIFLKHVLTFRNTDKAFNCLIIQDMSPWTDGRFDYGSDCTSADLTLRSN